MKDYRYYPGGPEQRETVEIDLHHDGQRKVTVIVSVDLLLCGLKAFFGSEGEDITLTPKQRLEALELVRTERKKITDNYPVKTYEGWEQSGLASFDDYCFIGDTVDEEMVDYFINVVPPACMSSACAQCGEPVSYEGDEQGNYRQTYTTFHRIGDKSWQFDGDCFRGENKNRRIRKTQLERNIEEARKELMAENTSREL